MAASSLQRRAQRTLGRVVARPAVVVVVVVGEPCDRVGRGMEPVLVRVGELVDLLEAVDGTANVFKRGSVFLKRPRQDEALHRRAHRARAVGAVRPPLHI